MIAFFTNKTTDSDINLPKSEAEADSSYSTVHTLATWPKLFADNKNTQLENIKESVYNLVAVTLTVD